MARHPKPSLTVQTSGSFDSVHLQASSRVRELDFRMKCKASWASVHLFFFLVQIRRFGCPWSRSGLTLWLQHLKPISWTRLCMLALNAQPQSTSCEAPQSSWIGFARQSSQGCHQVRLLIQLFPPHISLPVNFPWMFWFSLGKQLALSAVTFWVSMSVVWKTVSSLSHQCD